MPDGSSSAAPVTSPGPRSEKNLRIGAGCAGFSFTASAAIHRAIGQLLLDKIPRVRDLHPHDFAFGSKAGDEVWIDAGPIGRYVQRLISRDNLISERGIEMDTILVDKLLDRLVIAFGFD